MSEKSNFEHFLQILKGNRCLTICIILSCLTVLIVVRYIIQTIIVAKNLPKWWHRKRVLLTGASAGIGEDLAYLLAKYDCDFIITARRKKELEEVGKKCNEIIQSNGGQGKCICVVTDQSVEAEVHRTVETALKELGGLDVLLLNAASTYFRPYDTLTSKEALDLAHQIMNSNYFGMLTYYRDLLPELRKQKGNMLVVSSLSGQSGSPFSPFYSASKAAINTFIEGVTQEREDGVGIYVSLLGPVATKICLDNIGHKFYDQGMKSDKCARLILETAIIKKQFRIVGFIGYFQKPLTTFAPTFYRLASKMVLPSYDDIMKEHPQWKDEIPESQFAHDGNSKDE